MTEASPPPLPRRLVGRPINEATGLPWLWFMRPDAEDERHGNWHAMKMAAAVGGRRCYACGEPLGRYKCFLVPVSHGLRRLTHKAAQHSECAEFVAAIQPLVEPSVTPELLILWTTLGYELARLPDGLMIQMGPPTSIGWWLNGVPATPGECFAAMNAALPPMIEAAEKEGPRAAQDLIGVVAAMTAKMPSASTVAR